MNDRIYDCKVMFCEYRISSEFLMDINSIKNKFDLPLSISIINEAKIQEDGKAVAIYKFEYKDNLKVEVAYFLNKDFIELSDNEQTEWIYPYMRNFITTLIFASGGAVNLPF